MGQSNVYMIVLVAGGKMFKDKEDPGTYVHCGANEVLISDECHASNSINNSWIKTTVPKYSLWRK